MMARCLPCLLSANSIALYAKRTLYRGTPNRDCRIQKRRYWITWSLLPLAVSIVCAGCRSGETQTIGELNGPIGELNRQVNAEISRVPDSKARNQLLYSVGMLQPRFGNSPEAFNAINKIDNASVKEHALLSLAISQLAIARRNASERNYTDGRKAISIARGAVENVSPRGHGADAMLIASIKEQRPEKWEAEARLGAGDGRAVLEAQTIADPHSRARQLMTIAKAQAKQGEIDVALDTAGQIESLGPKWQALQAIAIAQSRAGDIAGAMKTIQQIKEIVKVAAATDPRREHYFSRSPALALAALAFAQGNAGDADSAEQSLSAAYRVVEKMHANYAVLLLHEITQTQLECGDEARAKQTLDLWQSFIRSREEKLKQVHGMWNESLRTLAFTLAQSGYFPEAMNVTGWIDAPMGPAGVPDPGDKIIKQYRDDCYFAWRDHGRSTGVSSDHSGGIAQRSIEKVRWIPAAETAENVPADSILFIFRKRPRFGQWADDAWECLGASSF